MSAGLVQSANYNDYHTHTHIHTNTHTKIRCRQAGSCLVKILIQVLKLLSMIMIKFLLKVRQSVKQYN